MQLHHIDVLYSPFDLADRALTNGQKRREILLCQLRRLPGLNEELYKDVVRRRERLLQGTCATDTCGPSLYGNLEYSKRDFLSRALRLPPRRCVWNGSQFCDDND